MTDEIRDNEPVEQREEVQLTPIQEKAMAEGWRPKEEYQGDPEKWVDAAEFLRRGELFSKIELQSKEIKQLKQTMTEFAKHHEKVR